MKFLFFFLTLSVWPVFSVADDYVSEPEFFRDYPRMVRGEKVPTGAIGYQVLSHNGKVHWITVNSSTIPYLWFDGNAVIRNEYVRSQRPPRKAVGYSIQINGTEGGYSIQVRWIEDDYFREQIPSFPGDASVGLFAYLHLVDEPIAPQSVDSVTPDFSSPMLRDDIRKEITKTPLASIKAMFDSAKAPDLALRVTTGMVAGKCVYRAHPELEVGAALAFHKEGQEQKVGIMPAARVEQLAEKASYADPNKFLDAGEAKLAEWLEHFRNEKAFCTAISIEPPDQRPLAKDSLFFDIDHEVNRGYRLRTFESPSKNTVYVVEGYAPRQGNTNAGKVLRFLEPVVYCYFYKTWSPSK